MNRVEKAAAYFLIAVAVSAQIAGLVVAISIWLNKGYWPING